MAVSGCPKIKVDGVDVCVDTAENFTFKCKYSLADQTVSDNYDVTGQNTEAQAEGTGTLGYSLSVTTPNVEIGEKVSFRVTPTNPGLVFATIKSCDVSYNGDDVTIIGKLLFVDLAD